MRKKIILLLIVLFTINIQITAKEKNKEKSEDKANIFEKLKNNNLSLSKSLVGNDKSKPAEFTLQMSEWSEPIYITNFALNWNLKFGGRSWMSVSAQGKLSNDDEKAENAWYYSLSFNCTTEGENPFYISPSIKYETDKNFDKTHKLMLSLVFTQTIRKLGIGKAVPKKNYWFSFRLRPFLGVDLGKNIEKENENGEVKDTILRLKVHAVFTLYLNAISRLLNFENITIDVSNEFYYLSLEDEKDYNKLDLGLNFYFSKYMSLKANYSYGYKAPKFEKIDLFLVAFGIKF